MRVALSLFAAVLVSLGGCADVVRLAPEAERVAGAQDRLYDEPYRPQVHFSPPRAWMNDPNGMVVLDGEYHLFYQFHPDSTVWGPMHWGHAVSRDLVTWEHLPIAIYPDEVGTIFSGSAVVDRDNTSGFQTGETPALVAVFTQHSHAGEDAQRDDFQTQSVAYSNDRGRTWTVYDGNPVLPNPGLRDFRDPKVFWHDETGRWVMALVSGDRVRFYTSPDLKAWTEVSQFGATAGAHGGVWECPDLFPLAAPDGGTKWVLLISINPGAPNGGSGTQYFVGDFDGTTFTPDDDRTRWLDGGRDDYAGVTWSDVPARDGRRLFIGWMSNWDYAQVVPTERWRSAMTLPRALRLVDGPDGLVVASSLVAEAEQLRGPAIVVPTGVADGRLPIEGVGGDDAFEVTATVAPGPEGVVALELANGAGETYRVGVDRGRGLVFSDRTEAGPTAFSDTFAAGVHTTPYAVGARVTLRVVVDRSSAEVFVDGGRAVMTDLFFPSEPFGRVALVAEGGARVESATAWPLRSIW